MDFFTSDLHIGHDKEFIWKARGFNSIEEHDTQILLRWNAAVSPKDTVYILGDLGMGGNLLEWNRIFKVLNGHIKFIHGNHDTITKIDLYTNDYGMEDLGLTAMYRYSKKRSFYLSHYPTLVGNHEEDRFFYNLSGHTHSIDKFQYGWGKVYNVAMDAHNCTPVSIEQIIRDIEKEREKRINNVRSNMYDNISNRCYISSTFT